MLIELGDLTAKLGLTRDDRMRLTLDFPAEPAYCDRVRLALADLIRPAHLPLSPHDPQAPVAPQAR